MKRAWAYGWMAGLVLALPAVAPAQETAAAPAPAVSAIWVEKDISFTYMGLTSYYSCDGLRDKVRWVLKQLGARPGFKVTARGCAELTGPERMPGVRIVAAMPFEATPELLAQQAEDASRRELAARASGKSAEVAEATAQFQARPRRVEFKSSMMSDGLQDGDCELMEQLRDRAFGTLGVKVVEDQLHCVPRQVTIGSVRLAVEVLEPVPAP